MLRAWGMPWEGLCGASIHVEATTVASFPHSEPLLAGSDLYNK